MTGTAVNNSLRIGTASMGVFIGEISTLLWDMRWLMLLAGVLYGKPIYISSGYRCPRLNKAVGGVAGSQHKTGQAADIQQVKKIMQNGEEVTVVDHEANRRVFKLIEENFDFDQLLWENGGRWVHVSFRADGKNRRQVKRLWKK